MKTICEEKYVVGLGGKLSSYYRYTSKSRYLSVLPLSPISFLSAISPHQFNTALPDLTDDGNYASSITGPHNLSYLLAWY